MSDQPKPKKIEYKPIRYFISPVNTFFGNILVQTLRNETQYPDNPNLIVGATNDQNTTYGVPDGIRKIIDTTKVDFFSKVLLDSDVIIYDLMTCNLNEAEYAIKTLKMGDLMETKILIFVSSVMVWSSTPPKEKKEGEEVDEGDPEEPDSEPEEIKDDPVQGDNDELIVKKEYVRFTEADYYRRRPLPQYEAQKALETMCLSAGNSKNNLKSFVLGAGIHYGMGEQVFYEHVKAAWLQNPPYLTYYGDGKNRIPCIHVKDLALFVLKIAERPPTLNYIFAIDHNTKPQQKKLIQTISKGAGTGQVKSVQRTIEGQPNEDVFTIDLRIRPTKAFDAFLEEAALQDDNVEDDQEPIPKYTFQWWCKDGLQKNMAKINKEFNENIKLEAIRIFITGPPAVGKTYWAKEIAKYFNLTHIHVKDVVDEFKNQQNEEGEALRATMDELKATMIEEAQVQYDQDKKKRKALGQPIEPFDESKILPRFNPQQLFQALKWRLQQNDCQNRGYVLDGYPKSYQEIRGVFLKPDKQDNDDQIDENTPLILDTSIAPQSVINFTADYEFLMDRVRQLPEEEIMGTHYSQDGMKKRLDLYEQTNKTGTGFPIMLDFFKEHKIDVLSVNANNLQNKIFDQCRSFIERNGRYFNYREQEHEKEIERLNHESEKRDQQQKKEKDDADRRDNKEASLWQLQEEEYKIKQQTSRNYEREVLDSRSQPLRQYLNDNVVPFITEGLIELIKGSPEDPVDFLAEYLFKRSLQVQFSDPGKYFEVLNEQ